MEENWIEFQGDKVDNVWRIGFNVQILISMGKYVVVL